MPGSGIFGTLGYAEESAWGTYTAPTHFLTVLNEDGEYKKGTVQASTLDGNSYDLSSRRSVAKIGAAQKIDVDMFDRGLGLLWKHILGAAAVTGSGPYTQVFTPGSVDGKGLSVQVGRPSTNSSTIQAMSYVGCKVTEWEVGCKAGDLDTFTVSLDSKFEDATQSYVAPSYVTSNILTSMEASLIIGGTVSTTTGVTSVTGGTTISLAREVSIKGSNKIDDSRYFVGSSTKGEQIANGKRQVTGAITLDFNGLAVAYNTFTADTPFALQLNITGPIVSGSTHSAVNILLSNCFWDTDAFPAKGPEIIPESLTFTALYDQVNNPVQVTLTTLDSAV